MPLVPVVNAKGDDWEVAVMGVSCRQQIEHGTGRCRARHSEAGSLEVEQFRKEIP